LSCWGSNSWGQLGNGSFAENAGVLSDPARVKGISDAVAIAVADSHSCALSKDGTVRCWGYNEFGAVNARPRSLDKTATPVKVEGVEAKLISVGSNSTCAALVDGGVSCWGCPLPVSCHAMTPIKDGPVDRGI
jgi:alpha-tubulin suppressor-like RCC1 family protein